MQADDAVAELAERARGLRWLTTDSAAARLDDEAQQFIRDRVDEHHAAIARFAGELVVEPPLRIERSLYAARFACGYVGDDMMRYSDDVPAPSERAVAWARALDRARSAIIAEARSALGSERCAAVIETVRGARREQDAETQRADRSLIERMRSMISSGRSPTTSLAPGGELFELEALLVATNPGSPSPWRPILNLWERGLAPLATLDGELLVYAPVYVEGALVGDPSPHEPLHPHDPRARFGGYDAALPLAEQRASRAYFDEGYRFMPREWQLSAMRALWTIVHRFARHGFAPTPKMMLFKVDTSPAFVATNTPALALTPYVPRASQAPLDAGGFDAWADAPDDDEALMARATPEGLAQRFAGFWDG